jgi:hypothetical protein
VTHDDSVHIAALSPAPPRALARARRDDKASVRQTHCVVVLSGHGGAPAALKRGSAMRTVTKFSASQSLENSQNGERISILREPVPGSVWLTLER